MDAAHHPPENDGTSPLTETDRLLERTILHLLSHRAPSATICPSDAARAVGGEGWRDLMDSTRQAAGRLVAAGAVDITQRGEVVDGSNARGPVRIRKRSPRTAATGDSGATSNEREGS